jgi:hypothetical protein
VWREKVKDDTIGETIKEANLEIYKGSFPEIREVDDEQFCSSGFYSSDQTDRLITDNPSNFLKASSFNGSSSKKIHQKPSIDSPIPGVDSMLSQIQRTKTDVCVSPTGLVSFEIQPLNTNFSETPKQQPETQSPLQINSNFRMGPKDNVNEGESVPSSPNTLQDNRGEASPVSVGPKNKENSGDNANSNLHRRNSPLQVCTDSDAFSKSKKLQFNMVIHSSPKEPSTEKRGSPLNAILESKIQKDDSHPRLFSKLTKTMDKSKALLIKPSDLSIEHRCVDQTPDQSVKNYSSFHSQLTNKPSRIHSNQGIGSGYRSPSMKGSSSPESRIKKMLKDSKGFCHTSTIQNLHDKSEVSAVFRRSEDKPKPKNGVQSFNFYQVIHGLKRPNLKSPQKFLGLRN